MMVYWIITVASVAIASVNMIFSSVDHVVFFLHYILVPALILTGVTALTDISCRWMKESLSPYVIILAGVCFPIVLVSVHYTVNGITSTFLLPLLASCIYYRRAKVVFAGITSTIAYFLIYLFHPVFHKSLTVVDIFTNLSIIVLGTIICIGIMDRGKEILEDLIASQQTGQELIIKKTLMEKMAKTDALTELNNSMAFHQYLDYLIQLTKTEKFLIHLALLDIDDFKKVNDTYGHHAGDQMLKFVASIIQELSDPNDFVARYGGEEFVMIYTEKTMDSVFDAVEAIRIRVNAVAHTELDGHPISISIGLNEYKGEGKKMFFEGADEALYSAKRGGKNRTVIYESVSFPSFDIV